MFLQLKHFKNNCLHSIHNSEKLIVSNHDFYFARNIVADVDWVIFPAPY